MYNVLQIAEGMRQKLGATADELPLVKVRWWTELTPHQIVLNSWSYLLLQVLECGTWAAGRAIAAEKRSGGGPPIQIKSDGTVF